MNIPTITIKSVTLATCVFWLIILTENQGGNSDFFVLFLLSLIPISICCFFTILFTIVPFFWFENKELDGKQIFKRYFPYYSIICFALSFYFSFAAKFNIYSIAFSSSAFITTQQAWVWLSKNTRV